MKVCLEIRRELGWTYWSGMLCLFGAHKGDRVLTKFSLEEQNINTKYIEDSSNIGFFLQNYKHFPCLRLLYEWISAPGQFSIFNLLGNEL